MPGPNRIRVKLKHIALIVVAVPALALVMILCVGAAIWAPCYLEPYTEAAKINLGLERSVSVYVETCWEAGRAVYYEVREAGKEIVPRTFLGSDDGDDRYTLTAVSAEDRSLFGIFGPTKSANRLFIMIDFKTGKSWPRLLGEVPYDEYDKAKRQASDLFDRLQRENPAITRPEGLSP